MNGAASLPRRRAGFTLLELVVVLMVTGLVFLLAGALQSSYGRRSAELLDRARAARDLQPAVEAVREDAGGAVAFQRWSPSAVRILRDGAPLAAIGQPLQGGDAGVQYELVGDALVRSDLEFGGSWVAATGLTAFDVVETGVQVELRLAAGSGDEAKEVFLRWVK